MKAFPIEPQFESWRSAAREALLMGLTPSDVSFEEVKRRPIAKMGAGSEGAPQIGASLESGAIQFSPQAMNGQRSFFEMAGQSSSLNSEQILLQSRHRDHRQGLCQNSKSEISPSSLHVPREFIELAQVVSAVRDESRWSLLYRLLFRLQFENRQLLQINSDDDVLIANRWFKSVCRDIHKMHAFVRFKEVPNTSGGESKFVAWHEPEHLIMRLGAPFFMRRFGDREWSIFSSDESAHWNKRDLSFGEGMPRHEFQQDDGVEDLWGTYYQSIFNPARMKPKMMRSEMATKYWCNLPEVKFIPQMLREAPSRLQTMALNQNVMADVPEVSGEMSRVDRLSQLAAAAAACRVCPFASASIQTVFGKGPANARLMIVGEQPGDQEDVQGQPFVGPAGQLLQEVMDRLGVSRHDVYMTNAVKHFKFTPTESGQRLHKKASGREAHACLPWLEAEIEAIQPKVILALGVTAATSILGRLPKLEDERGRVLKSQRFDCEIVISWHPSALLRTPDPELRRAREQMLFQDLEMAAQISQNI